MPYNTINSNPNHKDVKIKKKSHGYVFDVKIV